MGQGVIQNLEGDDKPGRGGGFKPDSRLSIWLLASHSLVVCTFVFNQPDFLAEISQKAFQLSWKSGELALFLYDTEGK